MTKWVHAFLIVIGYGPSCPLSSIGNDLHHYRMIVNLIVMIVLELETDSMTVKKTWSSRLTQLVDGLICLLEDPHMYKKHGTEKMHRMRHLANDYYLHGCFKSQNTSHWERGHSFFTKWAYDVVGRHGRDHSQLPPQAKMLLEVYTMFLATFFVKTEGPTYRDDNASDGEETDEEEDADLVKEKVNPVVPAHVHVAPASGYVETGLAKVQVSLVPSISVQQKYRLAFQSDTQDRLDKLRDHHALQSDNWKKRNARLISNLEEKEAESSEENIEYARPPTLDSACFYKQAFKSFSLTTTVTGIDDPKKLLALPDGRTSQKYDVGSCIVLEHAPDGVPSFAVIDAIIMDNKTNESAKIFVLVEYLYSRRAHLDTSRKCNYCQLKKKDLYVASYCIENQCKVCVKPPGDPSPVYESDESDEEEDGEAEPKKKVKKYKSIHHDKSMDALSKSFPYLHCIPYPHYHTTGSYDLIEIGNIVTKVNMVLDHRAFPDRSTHRAFFYLEKTLRNM